MLKSCTIFKLLHVNIINNYDKEIENHIPIILIVPFIKQDMILAIHDSDQSLSLALEGIILHGIVIFRLYH